MPSAVLNWIPLINQALLVLAGTRISGVTNLGNVQSESRAQQSTQQMLVAAVVPRRTSVAVWLTRAEEFCLPDVIGSVTVPTMVKDV